MANPLYNSYDQYVAGAGGDLYGSYDALPGAPGGGAYAGGGYDPMANYNSYDSYIGNGATFGGYPQQGGYTDPYAQQGGYGGRAPAPYDTQDIRGVGIVFDQKPSMSGTSPVFVRSVSSGSSADRSGRVRRGDVLLRVNGVDVSGRSIAALRPIVPGPAGSTVSLTFRRYDGRVYDVTLRRTTARLGKKNSRYYSGIRNQPAPQQQMQQYAPAGGMYGMYPPQQPQYVQSYPQSFAYAQPQTFSSYPGGTLLAGGGASYIMSQPQIMTSQQPISYITTSQPAQTFAAGGGAMYNNVTYTTTTQQADEIKGTQV